MGVVCQGETRLQLRGMCKLISLLSTLRVFLILLRALQSKKIPNIRDNFGCGWVGPGYTRGEKILGKSSQHSPVSVLIFLDSINYVFCLNAL